MINSMEKSTHLKRLHYRSWHRGCKETDLVLGHFADHKMSQLPADMLAIYELLLDENDADIWGWLTGKPAPAEYSALLALLQDNMVHG